MTKMIKFILVTLTFFVTILLLKPSYINGSNENGSEKNMERTPKDRVRQNMLKAQVEARMEENKLRRDEFKALIRQKHVEKVEVRTDLKRKRIESYFNRMVSRLEAFIARLNKLIDRIESRIAAITAEGKVDVSEVQLEVNQAKALLTSTSLTLETTKLNFSDFLSSEDPKENFKLVRASIQSIKKSLIEVHRILVHTIGNLKGLRVGPAFSPTASPTIEPTLAPTPTSMEPGI